MTLPDPYVVIDRGLKAKELVESKAFVDTINDLSSFFLAQMVSCPIGDPSLPALRDAHLMHTALGEIVSHLSSRVAAGEQAREALEETLNEDDI